MKKGDTRGITASKVGQDDSKDPNKNGDIEDPAGKGKPAEILQAVKPNKQGQQTRGSGKRPKKGGSCIPEDKKRTRLSIESPDRESRHRNIQSFCLLLFAGVDLTGDWLKMMR